MPKRKKPEETPEEQFKRFVETAEKVGLDETEADRSFRRLSSRQPKKKADPLPSE